MSQVEKTAEGAVSKESSQKKSVSQAQDKPAKETSIKIPSLEKFLEAGCHFGHKTNRWNPKMDEYIYDTRNGIHIIDLIKTMPMVKEALSAIERAADNGYVLIVGTKGQASTIVRETSAANGAFYVNTRWPGGLFTNFKMIKKSVSKLLSMEETLASGAEGIVKKEQLLLQRDVDRLNRLYEGIKFMDKLPSIIIVIDSRVEKISIKEAKIAKIPVVALVDTNCDPRKVDYPIPANDDSIKSISLFMELFGQAVKNGSKSDSLVALRQSHAGKLEKLRADYERDVKIKKEMEEKERERMKRLRAGESIESLESSSDVKKDIGGVVRVVQGSDGASKVVHKLDKKKDVEEKATEEKATEEKTTEEKTAEKEKESVEPKAAKKETDVDEAFEFSTRTQTALKKAGIEDISELKGKSDDDLLSIKGIGAKAVEEIRSVINK